MTLILEVVFLFYFIYVAGYTMIFSIAGCFYKRNNKNLKDPEIINTFGIFIPAYKEDSVIIDVARQALKQNYPMDNFEVIIVADSLKKSTIHNLENLPVQVCEVAFEKSTKVKALNMAFSQLRKEYDYIVILDADNLMEPSFLKKLNHLHQEGFSVVQSHRSAKNLQNSLAFLDGLSEEINNHIFCKGSTSLNLSSSLKGSGMSFKSEIIINELKDMDSIGGFDRELEVKLVLKQIIPYYAHDVIIYDEKVSQHKVFENQRRRWISSQYVYLRKYFLCGIKSLLSGNIVVFNTAVLRNIQLPRLLNLVLVFIFTMFAVIFNKHLVLNSIWWVCTTFIMYLGVMLSIPKKYLNKKLLVALFKLPHVFIRMSKALVLVRGANKKFIHTPHDSSSIIFSGKE